MTVFVVADTHVPDRLAKLTRKFLQKIKQGDIVLHAGDLVTLDIYRQLEAKAKVHAVCGNMDDFEVRDHLPKSKTFQLWNFSIGLCHGTGPPYGLAEKVYENFARKPNVVIFGHSHMPYNKKIGSTLMFNPGSLSGNLMSASSSYGILHIESEGIWGEIVDL